MGFRRHIAHHAGGAQLLRELLGPEIELRGIRARQGILKLRAARLGGDLDVLRWLSVELHTRHIGGGEAQALGDGAGVGAALVMGLQDHGQTRRVLRDIERSDAHHANDAGDVGVAAHDGGDLFLQTRNLAEGDIGRRLHIDRDEASVLHGQEALGDDDIEPDRQAQRAQRRQHHQPLPGDGPAQRRVIEARKRREGPFGDAQQARRLGAFGNGAQKLAAHHGRQRQGNHRRDHHRQGQRDREFAEHAAHDACHEQ